MREMDTRNDERSRSAAFMALLIEDVIAARERLTTSHTETARRDVVRASLAAIEGMTWVAREHVRTALAALEQLTPVADLAMRELSYSVSENGQPIEQVRVLPLLTAVRLVVWQAKIISPEISVEFSAAGWSDLRQAVNIRNRITHPKPDQGLAISDDDLAVVGSGMFWLLATVEYVMASTNLAFARHSDLFREIAQRLSAGDPDALAEYHAILREIQAED
jgi:hypothetical protein